MYTKDKLDGPILGWGMRGGTYILEEKQLNLQSVKLITFFLFS